MRRLTDISPGSVSSLLPVHHYYSVLVSYRLLREATYRLSFRLLRDAIGNAGCLKRRYICCKALFRDVKAVM